MAATLNRREPKTKRGPSSLTAEKRQTPAAMQRHFIAERDKLCTEVGEGRYSVNFDADDTIAPADKIDAARICSVFEHFFLVYFH